MEMEDISSQKLCFLSRKRFAYIIKHYIILTSCHVDYLFIYSEQGHCLHSKIMLLSVACPFQKNGSNLLKKKKNQDFPFTYYIPYAFLFFLFFYK